MNDAAFADALKVLPDIDVRRPLWEFPPYQRQAVIHERRVRFGIDDDEVGDPEYG